MAERKSSFRRAAEERAKEIGHPVDETPFPVDDDSDSTVDDGGDHPRDEESTKESRQEPTLYSGACEGGPMDGMVGQSRYPKGFLLADSHDSRAWVYDYDRRSGLFVSRKRDVLDRIRSLRAAEEANYDVRAYDKETMKGHP